MGDKEEDLKKWVVTVSTITEEMEDAMFEWSFRIKGRKLLNYERSPPMFVVVATEADADALRDEFDWINRVVPEKLFDSLTNGVGMVLDPLRYDTDFTNGEKRLVILEQLPKLWCPRIIIVNPESK